MLKHLFATWDLDVVLEKYRWERFNVEKLRASNKHWDFFVQDSAESQVMSDKPVMKVARIKEFRTCYESFHSLYHGRWSRLRKYMSPHQPEVGMPGLIMVIFASRSTLMNWNGAEWISTASTKWWHIQNEKHAFPFELVLEFDSPFFGFEAQSERLWQASWLVTFIRILFLCRGFQTFIYRSKQAQGSTTSASKMEQRPNWRPCTCLSEPRNLRSRHIQ